MELQMPGPNDQRNKSKEVVLAKGSGRNREVQSEFCESYHYLIDTGIE